MKITCISDTHMHHKKIIMPKTDMIIHAGDFTYGGEFSEVRKFLHWYGEQQAKHKLLICGNHEVEISHHFEDLKKMCENEGIQLLHNSHTVIEGLIIYGSPFSRTFGHGWAYMTSEEGLAEIYNNILPNVDIIVTHTPAYGRLDKCPNGNVGSTALLDRINELDSLKLHVTAHIHESRGTMIRNGYLTVNAAICGIPYTDVIINPITVEI